MSKWDKRFLDLSRTVSEWSKDPSTQVGAVIVDENKRIVSTGFNGLPMGVGDIVERLRDRDLKLKIIIHAEENAILFSRRDVSGMTIYVYPLPPCSNCASKIIQAGITRVVAPRVEKHSKWFESVEISRAIFQEAGVMVDLI